jgi:hypothetical protein
MKEKYERKVRKKSTKEKYEREEYFIKKFLFFLNRRILRDRNLL